MDHSSREPVLESLFLRVVMGTPWSLAATLMDSALESSKAFMAAYIWAFVYCFLLAYGLFLRGAEDRNGRPFLSSSSS